MPNPIHIRRFIDVNHKKINKKYAKRGILFTTLKEIVPGKTFEFYNQGCPNEWNIDSKKRDNFKIFTTGDSFSVLPSDVEMNGAHVTIHIGVQHDVYSPLVLLHEALQLCRTVYEHKAEAITIALPEQFHPMLHPNDFNFLLMRLFKVSGVNHMYFYDKNYAGKMDDKACLSLSDNDVLLNYIKDDALTLDSKVMQLVRKDYLNRAWEKFNPDHTEMNKTLFDNAEMTIPEMKTQPHVLLCCTANRPLAEKIAESLRKKGEFVKLVLIEGKGESATIPNNATICGAIVTIVQSTRPNPDHLNDVKEYQKNGAASYLFETAMIARQTRLRGALKVNLINPYQFGARSDKAENNVKGKTGAYVQQNGMLLEAVKIDKVITAECHDVHTLSGSSMHRNIKGFAVAGLSVMSTQIVKDWLNHPNRAEGQLRLVAPDDGAAKRTKELTQTLQAILGKQLCESRVLGEKNRDSHQDDCALINCLNTGNIGINAKDKYLITDDETATGMTLCQAVMNLKKNGATDITVAIVHNNMPLNWLERQLCLARFLHLGVSDLHFSDTQEMGTLAKSYDDMVDTYSRMLNLSKLEVETQVLEWFKKNINKEISEQEFSQFKSLFNQFESRIKMHSLADDFANEVVTQNPSKEENIKLKVMR